MNDNLTNEEFKPETFIMLKAAVETLLRHPHGYKWTVQGFGMMRCYFGTDRRFRLNVWTRKLSVPNVSIVHDHPWHFKSLVIAGQIENVRYEIAPPEMKQSPNHHFTLIKTGEGGGPVSEKQEDVCLLGMSRERYYSGDGYQQRADEIHATFPLDGTVTLNDREKVGTGEHARVFWDLGTSWVDAEPRDATFDEIDSTAKHSIERWFTGIGLSHGKRPEAKG